MTETQHPDGRFTGETSKPSHAATASTISTDEAALQLAEASATVASARERFRTAGYAVKLARTALSRAMNNWIIRLSPLENQRQFQARSQQDRADAVNAEAPAPRPVADSAIDRQAVHSKGGSPQARYGGFRRGAHDISQFGQRVKLPSER